MTRNRHIQLLTIEYAANARGVVKTHSYEQARGLLQGTTYSDDTTARAYSYNHLGLLTQVVDDAGSRTIGYNAYNEQESDSLLAGGKTHLVTELRDDYGRSSGYTYANNGSVQQTVSTGYGTDGRIASAGFIHGGAQKLFTYSYLPGTSLLQTLVKPNNMTLTQSYEEKRDLLIGQLYKRSTTTVASRIYTYDTLGRPMTRSTSKDGSTVNDSFGYNSRSELNTATVNNEAYAYAYDNIGNRETAQEAVESTTTYASNRLNQYTAIGDFVPTYDDAGNQTKVKTKTGIWSVVYNAENCPTSFTNADSGTIVECSYDYMGRRASKKVTVNGSVTLHQRFLYRDYLQIACCDLTRSNHPCLWLITWDPSQPVATRPLAIQKDGTWYTYGWDLTKNICEVYGQHGYIRTNYSYSPYGEVAISGDVIQPIQWSGEMHDEEISMVYYNFRYYNSMNGKWILRDPISIKTNTKLYTYANNSPVVQFDVRGLFISLGGCSIDSSQFSLQQKCPKGARKRQSDYYKVDIPGYHCVGKQYEYRTNIPKKGYTPSFNGCGGNKGIKVPEDFGFNIKEACDTHDRCYGTCGKDKVNCDVGLFRDIYLICMKDGGWYLHPICKRIATAYSGAVLIFGNKYYEEGQDEACEWQPCVE